MSFAERSKHAFSPRIVERGEGYFLDRKIYVSQLDGDRITAHVHGSSIYDVEAFVHQERRRLVLSCSCPYAQRSFCKHLWALVREMDRIAVYLEPVEPGALVVTMGEPALEVRWRGRRSSTPDGWRALIARAEQRTQPSENPLPARPIYAIDVAESQRREAVVIAAYAPSEPAEDGDAPDPPELLWLSAEAVRGMPEDERALVELLMQASSAAVASSDGASMAVIEQRLFAAVLPPLCTTGRFGLLEDGGLRPLTWDDATPRRFRVRLDAHADGGLDIRGAVVGGDQSVDLESCPLVLRTGLATVGDRLVTLDVPEEAAGWLTGLRVGGHQRVPAGELRDLAEALSRGADPRAFIRPLPWPVHAVAPSPRAAIAPDDEAKHLKFELWFDYPTDHGPASVLAGAPGWACLAPNGDLVERDLEAEAKLVADAHDLGLSGSGALETEHVAAVANGLLDAGWRVRAERRPVHRGNTLRLSVGSGVSWFDLSGVATFGDRELPLPALLAAVRKGEAFVDLGDGETGLLPEEWAEQLALLARARADESDLRFEDAELALLAALLEDIADVDIDDRYRRARDRIATAQAPRPLDPPDTFHGQLRDYQREGLGWMQSLTEVGMGGCLADDMGLGKTVQVLALLERRRCDPDRAHKPSLAVVPRSLIFNWVEEAARFTPELRVVDYSGPQRAGLLDGAGETDLFVTTYGTILRDIDQLEGITFDILVLDEAQAIKNPATKTAKACRRLQAEQRFALTGTPVENRLGDLASIFQYLNPGLIGRGGTVDRLLDANLDRDGVRVVGRVLRPFILRRTKEQVAPELPDKAEQLLVCDLEGEQRALYDELRDYYRQNLARKSSGRNRMMVLEALLRLRQAACHPGLIDRDRAGETSAKLDALTEKLLEVIDAGHNALVFSQFTSFLAIVKERLSELGVTYEYLDGRTRDRAARVKRFQDDPACPVFLISLKAGGHGLNLTAADYVFLLDPWWNPAVESQAIDRTHRIGQTRHVFAYRLIARDTVESKVLALQDRKRALAEGVIGDDNRALTGLSIDDLRDLLA